MQSGRHERFRKLILLRKAEIIPTAGIRKGSLVNLIFKTVLVSSTSAIINIHNIKYNIAVQNMVFQKVQLKKIDIGRCSRHRTEHYSPSTEGRCAK